MPATTQACEIETHLRQGHSITSLEAVQLFGCTRLAARINEMRSEGLNITDTWVTVPTRHGKTRVKSYRLASL
jgi:hypothetical protein